MKYIRIDIEWCPEEKKFTYQEIPIQGDRVYKMGGTIVLLPRGLSMYVPETEKQECRKKLMKKLMADTEAALEEAQTKYSAALYLTLTRDMEDQFLAR